jgi:hypothetical protein
MRKNDPPIQERGGVQIAPDVLFHEIATRN